MTDIVLEVNSPILSCECRSTMGPAPALPPGPEFHTGVLAQLARDNIHHVRLAAADLGFTGHPRLQLTGLVFDFRRNDELAAGREF